MWSTTFKVSVNSFLYTLIFEKGFYGAVPRVFFGISDISKDEEADQFCDKCEADDPELICRVLRDGNQVKICCGSGIIELRQRVLLDFSAMNFPRQIKCFAGHGTLSSSPFLLAGAKF